MRQFIHVLSRLPACGLAVALILGIPSGLRAQTTYRVLQQENFRREPRPTGRLLAQVQGGSELVGTNTQGEWVEITLEGWIWSQSVRAAANGAFDYEVSARAGENLRAEPNGQVLARLGTGFLLEMIDNGGDWVRVRRRGWMWGRSLERVVATQESVPRPPTPASPTVQTAPPPSGGQPPRGVEDSDAYTVTANRTVLSRTPDGDSTGVVSEDTPVRLLERRAGWVKVRVDAWVPENAVQPATDGILVGVSGAEVRARPNDFEGKVVQWTVQFIALRTADDLRTELPAGRQYSLVRGPMPEAGFAYVMVTDEQARSLADVTPLAHLVIEARVLVSRSRYLSNTVLELLDYSVRRP